MSEICLRGMTWNHERGLRPLVAASKIFKEKYGVEIKWDARSLSDFELFPLEVMASKYDLIMIDHPHIGTAHNKKTLKDLNKLLSPSFLDEQKMVSVGKSFESYNWLGHQYAIPLDAAAQVSAYRNDLFEKEKMTLPRTFQDVINYCEKTKYKIAIPFVPVHAYSCFFTLASSFSDKIFWSDESDLSIDTGVKVLELLAHLLKIADKRSYEMNPIDMLDDMSDNNDISYSPLVYGYSNYSRKDYSIYTVRFDDMPKLSNDKSSLPKGSMIGGVGISVSSKCTNIDAAIDFIQLVADAQFQSTIYFDEGGQPGNIIAWKDKHVNKNSENFFINTLSTLINGSLRPRFDGYIGFQAEAGERIREFIQKDKQNREMFIGELNKLIKTFRK